MKKIVSFLFAACMLLAVNSCEILSGDEPGDTKGAVDLGLSVKWATCNLGASSPEQSGNFYAWGETTPKTKFTWDNYKWTQEQKSS